MAGPTIAPLSAAAEAFDAIAEGFDERFGAWLSVAAQRRAVRSALLAEFPAGARLIEIGGGTGEDAAWLTRQNREVLVCDPAPTMIRVATSKLVAMGGPTPIVLGAEDLDSLADEREQRSDAPFDGAFSNFAALNCVTDLSSVARGLARLVRPGGSALLVLFGVCPPSEWIVEMARGNRREVFRRMKRGDVRARVSGREFVIRYHRSADVGRAFAPWFRLTERRGIGVFVPPSGAEPWISRHPRLLSVLDLLDAVAARPLAALGDHVMYRLERSDR